MRVSKTKCGKEATKPLELLHQEEMLLPIMNLGMGEKS